LQRIWQLNEENRKAKIAQFTKEYGFKLSFYKQGLCAIFDEDAKENAMNIGKQSAPATNIGFVSELLSMAV
jgi:hypothetical protein